MTNLEKFLKDLADAKSDYVTKLASLETARDLCGKYKAISENLNGECCKLHDIVHKKEQILLDDLLP